MSRPLCSRSAIEARTGSMEINYAKIRFGNWLYRYCFPLYNILYSRFKLKNDAAEIALIRKLVKPGDAILDIGANIGFYAKLLSEFTGEKGLVYCFEPDRTNFRRLEKNTAGLTNVRRFNAAVSDHDGKISVYRSKLLNVDHRTYPVEGYDSIEETDAVAIDSLIGKGVLRPPVLIKIDIQGYEMAAFRGMIRVLSGPNPPRVITEYWPHGFRRAGTSSVQFFDFFNNMGYAIHVLDGTSLRAFTRPEAESTADRPFEYSMNVLIEKV
jgi:FkbM family methyltransferase